MKQLEDTNVCILALTYGRHSDTAKVWANNLSNHRHPGNVHLYHWDNTEREGSAEMQAICGKYDRSAMFASLENDGIAKPLNVLMKIAFETGADYVCTMSNDMLEQDGWLVQMTLAAMQLQNAGIISIPPTDNTVTRYPQWDDSGWIIEEGDLVGNFFITRKLWQAIGGFSEDYGNYGPIDIDYCLRARIAGFRTIYLSNFKTDHIGFVQDKDYKEPKMKLLTKAWPIFWANCAGYRSGRKDIKM